MARSGRRPRLDKATVLRTSAELVDAEGWDALSLARLAEVLGVRAPSLYNHVSGLEGVRRGLAVLAVRELGDRMARAAIGKRGEEALLALAEAYRRFAKEHPGLYTAGLRAPDPDDGALIEAATDTLAVLRAVLMPYALQEETEIHAMRAFRSLVHGFVSLELAGGFGLPTDLEESYRVLVHLYTSALERQALGQAFPPD